MIVFPVVPDLGSPIGDRSELVGGSSGSGPPATGPEGTAVAVDSGLGSSCWSSSTLSTGESGQDVGGTPLARLSYSVSYFSWSVSEDSEEEEGGGLEALANRMERVKIRRSSRERNELRNSSAAAAQVSLALPSAATASSKAGK